MAVAVSGGPDSFALLHWVWKKDYPVHAFTVDHGLRPDAAKEARIVHEWCAARQIPHEILNWTGDKPASGIQAAARTARYQLLIEACYRHGIHRLLTAHTVDDQAETFLMRLRRGSGVGLAGILPEVDVALGAGPLIVLARPGVIDTKRSDIMAYAKDHDLPIIHDPSNDDEGYERIRLRGLIAALSQQELLTAVSINKSMQAISTLADRQKRATLADAEACGIEVQPWGAVYLTRRETVERLNRDDIYYNRDDLKSLVFGIVGALGDAPPTQHAMSGASHWTMTLSGVLAVREPSGMSFFREPALATGRADGQPGMALQSIGTDPFIWDRRFIIAPTSEMVGKTILPLGSLLPSQIVTSARTRMEMAMMPVIQGETGEVWVPKDTSSHLVRAFSAWKDWEGSLIIKGEFEAQSLFRERFETNVIRY